MPSWPRPGTKAHDALEVLLAHGPLTESGVWFHARGNGNFYGPLSNLAMYGYVIVERTAGNQRYAIADAGRAVLEGDQDA